MYPGRDDAVMAGIRAIQCFWHKRGRQGFQSRLPAVAALPTSPARGSDPIARHSSSGRGPSVFWGSPRPSSHVLPTSAVGRARRRGGAAAGAVATYLALVKPRVTGLVLFTAVAAAFAAARGVPPASEMLLLVATGALACGGAAALNHYFDRDIDREMGRTRGRPLAQGRIGHPRQVLVLGCAMVLGSVLWAAATRPLLAVTLLAGAFVYVVIYTLWLKRRSPLNIVIGGLAGSCAVIGGWVAIEPRLTAAPLLLAAIVFFWTPAHFWSLALARAAEYRAARVPMLPVVVGPRVTAQWVMVHIVWTVALSLWLQQVALLGGAYLGVALAGGGPFLWLGWRLLRDCRETTAWLLFKFSGPYLGLLFSAVLVDSVFTRA